MIFFPNVSTHRRITDARGANFCIRFARERALYTIRVRFKLRVNGKKIGGDLNVIFYTEIHADRRDISLSFRDFSLFSTSSSSWFPCNNLFSYSFFFFFFPSLFSYDDPHSFDFPFVIRYIHNRYSLAIDNE